MTKQADLKKTRPANGRHTTFKHIAIYLALGVGLEGKKELLGMWLSESEGAKFWLGVLTELQNRGVQDILIACVDGLKGFPDAINTVYPNAQVQLCIVHMLRCSMKFVPWKDKKAVAAGLKAIYGADTLELAEANLEHFDVLDHSSRLALGQSSALSSLRAAYTLTWFSLGATTGRA